MEYSWTNSQIEDPCVDDPIKIRDRNWEEKDGLLGVCQSNIGSGPTFGVPKNNILHVHIHEFHRSMWCIFKYNIMVWPVFCHCSQLPLVAWGWCTRDQLMMMYNNNRPVVDQLITAKTHAGLFREHPDMPNDASMTLYYAPCMKLVAATHVPHYNFITCVTFESHETITVVDQQFSCMQPRWWQSSAILTKTSQKTELSLGLKEILTQNQRLAIQQNAFDMNKFFPTHSYISHIYIYIIYLLLVQAAQHLVPDSANLLNNVANQPRALPQPSGSEGNGNGTPGQSNQSPTTDLSKNERQQRPKKIPDFNLVLP